MNETEIIHCDSLAHAYIHAVIIPRLAAVADANNRCQNITKKQDIVLSLVDAYRNISECCIHLFVSLSLSLSLSLFLFLFLSYTHARMHTRAHTHINKMTTLNISLNFASSVVSVDLLTDFILPGLESLKLDAERVAQDKLVWHSFVTDSI